MFGRLVKAEGAPKLGIFACAEAPGEEEEKLGRPLVGPSGKLFDRILSRTLDPETRLPFRREDFLIGNVVPWRPPNNELVGASYEREWIEASTPHLKTLLTKHRPKVILAMGATPLKWFTSHSVVKEWRGYVVHTEWGYVVPTYHPAYLLRGNMALTEVFQRDLLRAVEVARRGPEYDKLEYLESPSPTQAIEFHEAYKKKGGLVFFDIETPMSAKLDEEDLVLEDDPSYQITRISFSFEPFRAISMPWMPPFKEIAQRLLEDASSLGVWNEAFDVPRLQASGVEFKAPIYDFMYAQKLLKPHLPYGLKYVSTFYAPGMPQWKSLGDSRPEFYSAADSDVGLRCALGIEKALREAGKWDLFIRHYVQLGGILRGMTKRGILVDLQKRAEARELFGARYSGLRSQIHSLVPLELCKKKVFKVSRQVLIRKNLIKDSDIWIQVEEEMTPLEQARLEKREAKATEKAARKAARDALRAARKASKLARDGKPRVRKGAKRVHEPDLGMRPCGHPDPRPGEDPDGLAGESS